TTGMRWKCIKSSSFHPSDLHQRRNRLVFPGKNHARSKGAGAPVLRRRLERGTDDHLPVRDKIVERSERVLDLFQMPGQTRKPPLRVLGRKKTLEKINRIPDPLDPDPELMSLSMS